MALIVLVLSAVAALWWWSGREGSLEWALRRIARSQPLTAEGVQGSLRSGLHVRRLVWEQGGLKIEASDVELEWQPIWLLEGTIKLDHVHAAALRITDHRPPSRQPVQLPESLMIRPGVELDDLAIPLVEWITATAMRAEGLAGRYWFDGAAHWLRVDSVRVAGGTYRGTASLGALAPLPLDARLAGKFDASVPGAAAKLPLEFTAWLRGPVADLQGQASLLVHGASVTQAPRATATAHITPWAAQPVPQAQAELAGLDLASLWPQAPQTLLAGTVQLAPAGTATWQVNADLRNDMAGPWDQQRLPIEALKAQGQWRGGTALVQDLDAQLGGGQIRASGQWRSGADVWTMHGDVTRVDPAALHSKIAAVPVSGRVDVQQAGKAIEFDLGLQGSARAPKKMAARPRTEAARVTAAVRALELRQVVATGRWADGRLSLPKLEVRTSDASLQGALELQPQARSGSGHLDLQAPGLRAQANGELAETQGRGNLQLESAQLALAQRWLQRLPGMSPALGKTPVDGRATLQLAWQGGWSDPVVQASLTAPALELRSDAAADAATGWSIRDATARLNGRLSDASLVVHAQARQGQRQVGLDLAGRSGRAPARLGAAAPWRANVASFTLAVQDPAISAGTWQLVSQRAFDVRWSSANLDVSAGQAVLAAPAIKGGASSTTALLAWDPVRWGGGELRTSGRLTGLPMGWLELVGGPQLAGSALSGDMVFDAQWDASLGRTVKLSASLARSRGDVTVLAENVQGTSSRVLAGVRDARLTLASQGEQVTLTLRWDSERAGVADGALVTRLAPGGAAGWQWPASAPIDGRLRAQLPRIGVWSLLAPPGWRLRGSLSADVKAAGTKGDPQLSGSIAADDLALRSVVDGIELRNGRLRAALQGNRVVVSEFTLHGAGERDNGGTVVARGEAGWVNGKPQVQATAQLTRLRASIRADRQLTLSGNLAARLDGSGAEVNGRLKVDQARIVLPEENEPKLGDDVVVRNAPAGTLVKERQAEPTPAPASATRRLVLAVDLDLGEDFQLRGRGLQTRLRGTLALSGQSITAPRLAGTITTMGGEFRAYNQQLDVERGVLRFTGRIDNPALDILAIRPNITQRVGVLITGNAQAPFIRLYAEPDLPDGEKLAWLVTGRASPSGGAEAALVQEAALALLSSRRSGGGGLAGSLGLDQLSVRRDSSEGAVVTLGKRFARNFYASYERSLSGALGTLYIFYDVSRRLTVRAQAGERAGVDLIFTFAFD
jgi:translocation and assembly module TamB